MRTSLGTLVSQGNAPLGYLSAWAEGARRRIVERVPFSGSVVLSDPEIGQILNREGLWQRWRTGSTGADGFCITSLLLTHLIGILD